jgi:hypothetical protein
MTFRPRIRTLKPEMWADENVGSVSRDARLLFVGLITMADDHGRLRAMPAAILGHIFPYDLDALKKLAGWIDELAVADLALPYTAAGHSYIVLPGFERHQVINRKRSPLQLQHLLVMKFQRLRRARESRKTKPSPRASSANSSARSTTSPATNRCRTGRRASNRSPGPVTRRRSRRSTASSVPLNAAGCDWRCSRDVDQWVAQCPTHDDSRPSLVVRRNHDGSVWLKCWGGCSKEGILAALGLEWRDLWEASERDFDRAKPVVRPLLAPHLRRAMVDLLRLDDERRAA